MSTRSALALAAVFAAAATVVAAQSPRFGVGRPATPDEIRGLGVAVAPDGGGLPEGSGTVAEGRAVYAARCEKCHGPNGEGGGVGAALVGGKGTLATARPLKTVGSFWPQATTVWDYVNRAMPFDQPGLLTPREVYAVVAYVLNLNGIVGENAVMDARSLPKVVMPNHDGFVADPRPDVGPDVKRGAATTDWPSTNYDQTANRYSPLTQITARNVSTLERVWSFHLKPAGFTGPGKEDEAIPIVIGNTMYLASPYGAVIALDATTGVEKWRFQLPENALPSKRGLAYWPGGGDIPLPASIIFGSTTGGLYSIKASDGTPNEWFGENGVVNLKTREVMHTGMTAGYSLLSSPTIYKDLIITGAGTGEGPGGSNGGAGPAGDTRAWDARTGKLVWAFHTVPRPGEFGYDTWGGDSAKDRSGVNVWGYTSLDAQRGILYMPLGAPNNDRVGIDRPGNNLFSSSVVAVDANTGKYLWHFQVVHHDIWDYDTQSAPLLVDLRRDGQIVPAVIVVNKTGLMFTFNRVTGKPLFDIEERPVPKSDVPGEQASPTQPFPVKPEPLTQNTISRGNLYKGEPQHQSYCEHMVDDNNMKLGGPYMPIAFNQYSISPPGPAGGINFWGPAYDPELHLFVSNTSNIFQPMRIIQRPDGSYANSGPLAGTRRFGDPDRHLLCGPTPWGELVAVNMDTGNIAYRKTLGVSDLLPAGMQDTGRPSSGGVILTASGLTFVGGTDDFRFRAFATATGEKLWEIRLPSSVETTPITYMGADGRQFVTVVSTGGGLTGSTVTNDEIIAFALPKP